MHDQNAANLLAKVMGWQDLDAVPQFLPDLQLLAEFKYDHYQRFGPGRRFIESLALWLHQFSETDRKVALRVVTDRLVYFSDAEFSHLVGTAYPDWIVQERIRLVSEEFEIPSFRVQAIARHRRFEQLRLSSLYLGLSPDISLVRRRNLRSTRLSKCLRAFGRRLRHGKVYRRQDRVWEAGTTDRGSGFLGRGVVQRRRADAAQAGR